MHPSKPGNHAYGSFQGRRQELTKNGKTKVIIQVNQDGKIYDFELNKLRNIDHTIINSLQILSPSLLTIKNIFKAISKREISEILPLSRSDNDKDKTIGIDKTHRKNNKYKNRSRVDKYYCAWC